MTLKVRRPSQKSTYQTANSLSKRPIKGAGKKGVTSSSLLRATRGRQGATYNTYKKAIFASGSALCFFSLGNIYSMKRLSALDGTINNLRGPFPAPDQNPQKDGQLDILVYETDGPLEIQKKYEQNERKLSEVHPHLQLLTAGKDQPGIKLHQLGANTAYSGFSVKWDWVANYLMQSAIEDHEIVAVSDNRDVLINIDSKADTPKAIKDFKDYVAKISDENKGAVLISGEEGCCVGALTYAKPGDYFDENGQRTNRACNSGEGGCQWKYVKKAQSGNRDLVEKDLHVYARPWMAFQEAIGRSKVRSLAGEDALGADSIKTFFLNMGLLAGRKRDIIAFIKALDLKPHEDDQAVATDYFFRFPEKIVIDYVGRAFGNNDWKSEAGCKFHHKNEDKGQLYHQNTQKTPLFLHYPGLSSNPEHIKCLYHNAEQLGHSLEGLSIADLSKENLADTQTKQKIAVVKSSISKKELLEDLDFNVARCGAFKCFFQSKDKKTGWLLANDRDPGEKGLRFKDMPPLLSSTWQAGWELAKKLEDQYNIRHFMMEPPVIIDDSGADPHKKSHLMKRIEKKADSLVSFSEPILAQKIRVAPSDAIELKTFNGHFKSKDKKNHHDDMFKLRSLLEKVPKNKLASFTRHFSSDIDVIFDILKDYPLFAEDFQIMVDPFGRVYHIDFDGHFNYFWWSPTEPGDLKSKVMVEHVRHYLHYWKSFVRDYASQYG